ncbi:hypothetical protein [Vitiosangium sp. GDMCC 1.1324]|uniref:hypothetical protein n=1 Tax=Vitiosangium sp. (strain GDMCC 1.1324) TaxID=2138576 RepID=UPI000D338F9F|nr:hypothetical protein [Vitiosangium sp. GDMCC 1.1324]PTL84798.1 hypothetical protein DAT35_06985 [Vitiosangium sp. GDMCC 1.1324]
MDTLQTATLQLPSFLYGPYIAIKSKTKAEGRRCAKQYELSGTFPQPRELRTVAPGDVVFTHEVVDFQDELPAWRLYAYWEAITSMCDSLKKSYRHIKNTHETFFRETAWGALFFALSGAAPESAELTALRLQAVLRFWDSLQHGRYLYKTLNTFMTLEELMTAACGWAMDAWCPKGGSSVRSRFEVASERMAQATREESIEAILRQLPHILPFADRKLLNHPEVVMDPSSWREHLSTLDAAEFERISGVRPGEVLGRLYVWDKELDIH